MLDTQYILDNVQKVKDAITNKHVRGIVASDVDTIVSLIGQIKSTSAKAQKLRTERNEVAQKISQATDTERAELIEKGKQLKEFLQQVEGDLSKDEKQLNDLMMFVPNVPSADTPVGPDEGSNVVVRTVGEKPKFDFEPKDHVDLLAGKDLLDLTRGSKVSGFRGYYLKGTLATLQWATLMYAYQKLVGKGYTPVIPPILIKEFTLFGSGHKPWSGADVYQVTEAGVDENGNKVGDAISLAGTAEIPLMGMFADETLDIKDLPIRMVGISPCYRKEIGSYSRDVRGIYRVHEFMKLEQVIIAPPDDNMAEDLLQELMANSEEILKELKLHYQVLSMCTGDMGEPQYKKYDIETWMPGKGKFGETHSASNMSDFQCRRNNIRVKTESGEKLVAYSLNNTAVALPRLLVAIVENYQRKDGTIEVPEVLRPFVGKEILE